MVRRVAHEHLRPEELGAVPLDTERQGWRIPRVDPAEAVALGQHVDLALLRLIERGRRQAQVLVIRLRDGAGTVQYTVLDQGIVSLPVPVQVHHDVLGEPVLQAPISAHKLPQGLQERRLGLALAVALVRLHRRVQAP